MAGLLALLLFLAVDLLFLSVRSGPWDVLHPRVKDAVAKGVVSDRLALRQLLKAREGKQRAVVVGSSRAGAGFRLSKVIRRNSRNLTMARIAHGGIRPFEIRSLVGEVQKFEPDALVMVLSEFDIYRPVYVGAQTSFGSGAAVRDLIAETDAATCFEKRRTLFRLTTAALFDSYRFRRVFHEGFANDLRRFPLDERLVGDGSPPTRSRSGSGPWLEGGEPMALGPKWRGKLLLRLKEEFPGRSGRLFGQQIRQIREITRGPHSAVQAGLIRRAVRSLSRAGVRVVIAEAPLHPLAVEMYDPTIRDDFLTFTSDLAKEFGVRFVPIEESGPYLPQEFKDLTHLEGQGTTKLTHTIVAAIQEVLGLAQTSAPAG